MVLMLSLFRRSPIKSFHRSLLLQESCHFSSAPDSLVVQGTSYPRDTVTNISPRILKCMDRNLHLQPSHPLCLIKQRIANYMYKRYRGTFGQPAFSLHETLSPVVTTHQNFDSLLVPPDHVSRSRCSHLLISSRKRKEPQVGQLLPQLHDHAARSHLCSPSRPGWCWP